MRETIDFRSNQSNALLSYSRPSMHFKMGDKFGKKMAHLFDEDICPTVFATCRIYIFGALADNQEDGCERNGYWENYSADKLPKSVGKGRGAEIWMQTYGNYPKGSGNNWRHRRKDWIWARQFSAVDEILACFDLTVSDVLERWGDVEMNERKIYDLVDIVRELRPEFV